MIYVGNAFSLQMVQNGADFRVDGACPTEVKIDLFKDLDQVVFCIGHADTARMAAKSLNQAKAANAWRTFTEDEMFIRQSVTLVAGDVLYVMQVTGGRLPEGCTELPEGVQLVWRKVTVR